jgi:putative ABC transport system permease protein
LGIGAAVGIAGGLAAAQVFQTMLYGVGAIDPLTIGVSILTLILISITAAILPARRAMRVDPMIALRYE